MQTFEREETIMFVTRYQLIVPRNVDLVEHALAPAAGDKSTIQVFQGTQAVKNYGITVQGSGVTATGHIGGSLTTYDYKALYQIFTLKDSESANYWFVSYSKSTSHDQLQKVAESSQTLTTNYSVDFTIQGNDLGVQSVFITFEVIRVVYAGITKDFVVTNPASCGANNSDGSTYQGTFVAKPGAAGAIRAA
jgi:hypothetical protein